MSVKSKQARPYHHGDLRQALVLASIAILKEEGATALTLRSAARRVGVSHAAPKNHFGDLRGLFAAVAIAGFRGLAKALHEARSGRDARLGLVAAAQAYVRFAVESPGAFRAMFHPVLAERSVVPELEEASRAAFAELVTGIVAAQAAGVVTPGDAEGKSLTAWSFVHGLASLAVDAQLTGKGISTPPEVLAALGAQHLFDGLGNVGGVAQKRAMKRATPGKTRPKARTKAKKESA